VTSRAAVSKLAHRLVAWLFVLIAAATAGQQMSPSTTDPSAPQATSSASVPSLPTPFGRHTDDLDGMVKRQNIRALVIVNPIGFFYDNGQPMGVMYDALRSLETYVNAKLKTDPLTVEVTFVPVAANQIEAALTQGVGDLIAYATIVSPERAQQVAFTAPLETDVKQVIVTGPTSGTVSSLESLSGKEVYVNPLSTMYQNLLQLNATLERGGQQPMQVKAAGEYLLDDDLARIIREYAASGGWRREVAVKMLVAL